MVGSGGVRVREVAGREGDAVSCGAGGRGFGAVGTARLGGAAALGVAQSAALMGARASARAA